VAYLPTAIPLASLRRREAALGHMTLKTQSHAKLEIPIYCTHCWYLLQHTLAWPARTLGSARLEGRRCWSQV